MKTILIIDDNRLIVSSLSLGFHSFSRDWRILTAFNGQDAIEILESQSVDFILTDLNMPVMDGYAFLAYAREHRPSVPAVAMTALFTPETERRLRSLGITEVVEKPFSFRVLAETIAGLLKNKAGCTELSGLPTLKVSFCS